MFDKLINKAAGRLRFPGLLTLMAVLFVADLLVPDMLPFVDEILLGLGTLLLARIREPDPGTSDDHTVEVIEDSSHG